MLLASRTGDYGGFFRCGKMSSRSVGGIGRVMASPSGICFEMLGDAEEPVVVFVTAEALSGDVLAPLRRPDEMLSAFEASRLWIEIAAKKLCQKGSRSPILIRDIPMVI